MSIFGSSSYNSPWNLNLKALPNLYVAENVVRDIHFKNMMNNVKAEFMEFVDAVLGKCTRRDYWYVDDGSFILNPEVKVSPLHSDGGSSSSVDVFMSRADHSMYYSEGYHIPLNLTNLALQNMREAEYAATYYCKFDTSPLPVYDVTNELSYIKNSFRVPYTYQGQSFKDDKSLAKWFYNYRNVSMSEYYGGQGESSEKEVRHIKVPKVRVNTWKIPIFTDGHYNSVALKRDLFVKKNFIPSKLSYTYLKKKIDFTLI